MPRPPLVIVCLLAAMALADVILCRATGLAFTEWGRIVPVCAAIAAIGWFYHRSGRGPRIARMALWIVLWVAFSAAGAVLTYAAAARGGALHDAGFAALDHALGFDWTLWYEFVGRHRALKLVLGIVYVSLMAQILFSVFVFSFRGWDERNGELLLAVIVGLIVTTALFAMFPTLGPCAEVPWFGRLYVDDLIAVREHTSANFALPALKGIVAFPSFHAVLAALFTYAHRGWRGFAPIAALNAAMLVAIPSEGGHYLVDVVAGLAIAGLAILAVRAAPTGRRPALRPHPA